jgi:hypothetical protein
MTHVRVPLAVAFAAVIGLAIPSGAEAQHAAKSHGNSDAAPGQQAAVDAQGKLREPTPDERKALADEVARSVRYDDAGLTPVHRADGSVLLDLQGRFETASVARVHDGRVETRCVTSRAEAEAFLDGKAAPARPTPPLEER